MKDSGYEVLCHEGEMSAIHKAVLKAARKEDVDLEVRTTEENAEGMQHQHMVVIRH